MRGPEGEALRVALDSMARIEKHEAVCTERYQQIVANMNLGAQSRSEMHDANQESLRRIYALIWKLVIGTGSTVILLLLGGLCTVLWYMLTH